MRREPRKEPTPADERPSSQHQRPDQPAPQDQLKVTVYETDKAMAKIGGQLAQLQAAAKSTDATK